MMKLNDTARQDITGTIRVIGVGQSLRGDDAAGLEAVQLWLATYQGNHPGLDIQVELAELPGLGLLNLLEGCQAAILVDAVHGSAEPGTIYFLSEGEIASFTDDFASAHGWGVAETLSLGRELIPTSMPKRLAVIGIEAGQVTLGEGLSAHVRTALPKAAEMVEQYIVDVTGQG
jgi:hydrogenase maturation protease